MLSNYALSFCWMLLLRKVYTYVYVPSTKEMVLFHSLRSIFYILQGVKNRSIAIAQYKDYCKNAQLPVRTCPLTGSVRLPWTSEVKNIVYMGLRTSSHFPVMHVNHARFAEALEFVRWHSLGLNNSLLLCKKAKLYPTIQSLDLQYLRELPVMSRVISRLQYWGVTEDGKAMNCRQQLESVDGKVIYATGFVRVVWVNHQSYRLADGKKPQRGGAVLVKEAMTRLGCDDEEIEAFHAYRALDDIDIPFGGLISSYDTMSSRTRKSKDAIAEATTLHKTYPCEEVKGINAADTAWRSSLSSKQRNRKAFISNYRL